MKNRFIFIYKLVFVSLTAVFIYTPSYGQNSPLKVVIVGLSHDHIHLAMQQYKQKKIDIKGIVEKNQALVERYKKRYELDAGIFFPDLDKALKKTKPQVVLAYNPINEHVSVVEKCAPLQIPVMVEKPLATTLNDAKKIETLSKKYNVPVLVNYETTWYVTNHLAATQTAQQESFGMIRKMVAHDGHEGPKEIGVSKDFLAWLTDPVKNGGGAVMDFGCYGANLMTWLMKGEKPVSVSAITKRLKPHIYPKVDDDATVILEYKTATGIIEASWNWPFSIKDLEIFGDKAYIQAVNPTTLRVKKRTDKTYTLSTETENKTYYRDNIEYLTDFFKKKIKDQNDLSSLSNNVTVVEILEAAKESARTGRKVYLTK